MINIRLADTADQRAWDQYVEEHPLGSPYHLMAWSLAIRSAYRQQVYCLMAQDQQGRIQGLLPIAQIGLPLLNRKLCSLPYCDLGGILSTNQEAYDALLQRAQQLARERGNLPLELRHSSAPNHAQDSAPEPQPGQKVRMLLPLPGSADALLAGFKAKLRSQIKKAEKNGICFRLASTPSDRAGFYEVMQINMRELGSPVHAQQWFEHVLRQYGDNAILGLAEYKGIIVGGAIVLLCGDTATVPWASTLPDYNRLAPNMALYWGILSHAADRNCRYFDFGRSTVGEGTYRFKQQWGAKPIMLDWQTWRGEQRETVHAIEAGSEDQKSRVRDWIAQIWRALPHGITNLMGPLLRRHISL